MCGIAGYFDTRGSAPIAERELRAMTDALAHRGPDGHDLFRAPGVGFGHRRLAIIDLETGAQPMLALGGQVAIVFNGEIYNYADIRRDLERLGHAFRTHSDTETILLGWIEWGARVVDRLRGMFAFAISDTRTGTLFLARDRLGVKPLHYTVTPDGALLFASELKGLLASPRVARHISRSGFFDSSDRTWSWARRNSAASSIVTIRSSSGM